MRHRLRRGHQALALTRAAALFFALALPAHAAVRTVGPAGCAHTSLASAVAAAEEGDLIRIHHQYDADTNVLIDKSLTLVGGLEHCFVANPPSDRASVLASADPAPGRILDIRGADVVVELYHLRLTGATSAGALNVQDGATVRLTGVEIDTSSALVGGGLWLHGNSRVVVVKAPFPSLLHGLSIHHNEAPQGGGVYIDGGSLLEDEPDAWPVSIWANEAPYLGAATGRGGGVYMRPGARMLLDKGSLFTNTAQLGGAVYVSGRSSGEVLDEAPDLRVVGTMNQNAAVRGGAVYVAASDAVEIELDRLLHNDAVEEGGGLWFGSEGSLQIGVVEENSSAGSGGGIQQSAGSIRVRELLIGNSAAGDGGAFMATGGVREFDGGIEVSDNLSTGGNGGALAMVGAGQTRIPGNADDSGSCSNATPCRFLRNLATGSGGAMWFDGSELLLYGSLEAAGQGVEFDTNFAVGSGGAIRASSGARLSFQSFGTREAGSASASLWRANVAGTMGGAISLLESSLSIRDARFGTSDSPNSAPLGGAIAVLGQDVEQTGFDLDGRNLVFRGNEASSSGGAIVAINGARIRLDTLKCESLELPSGEYCSGFFDNVADGGAAIAVNNASLQAGSTAFVGNRTRVTGAPAVRIDGEGDVSRLENVLIADTAGSALGLVDKGVAGTRVELASSTIAGNDAGIVLDDDSSIEIDLEAVLAWDNQGDAISGLDGAAAASQTCSLLQGGALGALDLDPLFTTTLRGSWRIRPASPAAMQCVSGPVRDLDGNLRSAMHDIGALVAAGELPVAIFADGYESP